MQTWVLSLFPWINVYEKHTEASTRPCVESGPLTLGFATQLAIGCNPALGFELFGIRTPDLFTASLSVRAPQDVVAFTDVCAVWPDVVVQGILLVQWNRRIEAQHFVKPVKDNA